MKTFKKTDPTVKYICTSRVLAVTLYLLNNLEDSLIDYESDTRVILSIGFSDVKIDFVDESLKKVKFLEGDSVQIDLIKSLLKIYMKDHYLKDKIEGERILLEHQLLHNCI